MARKCFVSFKAEDIAYKNAIQNYLKSDMIDKSLDKPIDSSDEDYIMKKIRSDYLADSSVTIHLIGAKSAELMGAWEQRFIKRELQASLYDGEDNRRSGVLGIVLPNMSAEIYKGSITCTTCGSTHALVDVSARTTIAEFHYNYYIPNGKCHYPEDDRYCVLATWDDFAKDPANWIEQSFRKRDHPIAKKVKVRP